MNESMSDRPSVLRRSLAYYAKKLTQASEDDDIGADIILKNELIEKASNVNQVLGDIGTLGGFEFTKNGIFYREVMCDALTIYIDDMKKSLSLVQERFTKTHESFKKLSFEIEVAETAKADICKIYSQE